MIEMYFDSICRIIVKELTALARKEPDMDAFVLDNLTEADIVYRLGQPFGHLARFRTVGPDIQIQGELDFDVEVKYWRKFKANASQVAAPWVQSQKDFDRLFEALTSGRRGRFSFIIGWPTVIPWNQIAQLGMVRPGNRRPGLNPMVDQGKLLLLPFLTFDPNGGTRSIRVDYDHDQGTRTWRTPSGDDLEVNWRRIGTQNDVINMAMYW